MFNWGNLCVFALITNSKFHTVIPSPHCELCASHFIITPRMETFSVLLAICVGNSLVPVISLHKGQRRRALMFSLICVWINGWVKNRGAGDLTRYRKHYDVTVMYSNTICFHGTTANEALKSAPIRRICWSVNTIKNTWTTYVFIHILVKLILNNFDETHNKNAVCGHLKQHALGR